MDILSERNYNGARDRTLTPIVKLLQGNAQGQAERWHGPTWNLIGALPTRVRRQLAYWCRGWISEWAYWVNAHNHKYMQNAHLFYNPSMDLEIATIY